MEETELNVLVIAASAHPRKGSEPGLGWRWLRALAQRHRLWAIVGEKENNREAIEEEFEHSPWLKDRLRLHLVPRPAPPAVTKIWPPLYYRYYRQWHRQAFRLANQLRREVALDLAHQLNMTGYREPGYAWKLDLPFVWGPIGGLMNANLRLWRFLGLTGAAYYLVYDLINSWQIHAPGRVRRAFERADALVTFGRAPQQRIRDIFGRESAIIQENGSVLAEVSPRVRRVDHGPLRIVWSGLHVFRKALPILLRALPKLPSDVSCHLDILGRGPMTKAWRALATRLKIDDRCTWHGWLPRDEALEIMQRGHIFALTSVKDAASSVLMEALSIGLPVVCLDHCGFSDVVTQDCGIKIAVTSPRRIVRDFAGAIGRLASGPSEVSRLSTGAIQRARDFTWEKQAEKMSKVYASAITNWTARSGSPAPK